MSNQINLEPNKEYSLTLTGNDLINLQVAIMELAARIANPLNDKITKQIKDQGTSEMEVLTPEPE